jgi:hypothetical protein
MQLATVFAFLRQAFEGFLIMSKLWRRVMLVGFVLIAPETLIAQEPFDSQDNAGATSYITLPFQSSVIGEVGAVGLSPMELYYTANPASPYNKSSQTAQMKANSQSTENAGLIPNAGTSRWEDTWEISQPASNFPGEPSWISSDRTSTCNGYPGNSGGTCTGQPEFVAWGNWIKNHPQYWDTAWDGGTMPGDPDYFRSWNSQWGHISPLQPLAAADCPPGFSSGCFYSDLLAYQWAKTVGLSLVYGVALSDFSDSQPAPEGQAATEHDFNPSIVKNFAAAYSLNIPSSPTSAQASWIMNNARDRWVDFIATGYANFFNKLAIQSGKAANRTALIIDQCAWMVDQRRILGGIDQRIIATVMGGTKSYVCGWDNRPLEFGGTPSNTWMLQGLMGAVMASAREPLIRNGATLESDNGDSGYQQNIINAYPTLSSAAQTEIGNKLLKREWAWHAFSYIADRSGNVRRALCYVNRDDFDGGDISAINPLATVMQSVYPVRPFGAAYYYSDTLARAVEYGQLTNAGAGNQPGLPYYMSTLQQFVEGASPGSTVTPVGYYISDAALPKITKGGANAPFAWVVIDPTNQLTSSEQSELAAIAPVVKSQSALAALPNNPLTLPAGMSGFGFYDQNGRLILVLTNISVQPNAGSVSGTISLNGTSFSNGTHTWTSLLTRSSGPIGFSNGFGSLAKTLTRWDTDVIAISP